MISKPWMVLFAFAVSTLALSALAAPPSSPFAPLSPQWLALESRGSIVTFSGLDRDGIVLLLGTAQRLVADPQTGAAVAELLPGQLPRLAHLRAERSEPGACEALFTAEAGRAFPNLAAEAFGSSRYLRKIPSTRVIAPDSLASRVQRRESAAGNTCLFEGFEETPIWYEDGGPWFHYEAGRDNNQGDYFWLDEDCTSVTGDWSACAVFGGDYGMSLNCFDDYDTTTDSWMKYAYWINCVAGYGSATLNFAMTLKSELDYDTFGYYVSLDDSNYYGYYYSGDFSSTWYSVSQDLRNFYGLGDLTTYPEFALAFNFYADDQVQEGWGAFVDDISITVDVAGITDVVIMRNPFRLLVAGTNFMPAAWVYIDGKPVPAVRYKRSTLIVAKSGRALKNMVDVGEDVCVQVMNADGATTGCYWFRY